MPKIAVLPGDGIGPEVVEQGLKVLEALNERDGLGLEFTQFDLGAERFLRTGETMPDADFEALRDDYDAIYLGAFGDPRVPNNEHARDILLGLRFRLDLYVNLRPVRLLSDALSPLKGRGRDDIDFVILRENTEGLYTGHGRIENEGTDREWAVSEMRVTRAGVERILRAAFEYASERGNLRVCMSDKSNAVGHVGRVWQRAFGDLRAEYPDIEARHLYIDALCMEMVRAPQQFDVIVAGNLFGDILSDIGAQLQGGMGLAASANLHPEKHGMFEPVHGTAPDIAGQGIANPLGAILSAVHMLDYLGFRDTAAVLHNAVVHTLNDGVLSRDLGGVASTEAVGEAVLAFAVKKS